MPHFQAYNEVLVLLAKAKVEEHFYVNAGQANVAS